MPNNKDQTQVAKILLVDDQPANLDVLYRLLELNDYEVAVASSGPKGIEIAHQMGPDLILLDVMMPGMDGFATCHQLKQDPVTEAIPIIFITARNTKEDLVRGFGVGGVDYITKPFQEKEVLVRLETHVRLNQLSRALEYKNGELEEKNSELQRKNNQLEEEIARRKVLKGQLTLLSDREIDHWGLEGFVGQSETIKRIFKEIRLMQANAATSVLITGESGTGKELLARAIHFGSGRNQGPFVPVNCAALPRELAESLLFGSAKGAFTGASADRIGYFEMADQGSLFLDEIGEMPLEMQAKLLRVLEDGQVEPLGSTIRRKVDVRVLAATNVDVQRLMGSDFRQDLFFRLARFTVVAPPLRQRRDDIPLLTQHFLRLFAREMGIEPPDLSPEVVQCLRVYDFPGNVRELKNIVERALIESGGRSIQPHHLHFLAAPQDEGAGGPPKVLPPDLPLDLDQALMHTEQWVVKRALEACNGNVSEAARLMGTTRNRTYRILGDKAES